MKYSGGEMLLRTLKPRQPREMQQRTPRPRPELRRPMLGKPIETLGTKPCYLKLRYSLVYKSDVRGFPRW
jgi:hypothetical protein